MYLRCLSDRSYQVDRQEELYVQTNIRDREKVIRKCEDVRGLVRIKVFAGSQRLRRDF